MPWSVLAGRRTIPGPGEQAFTDLDLELALEWVKQEKDHCPGCGYPVSLSTDVEHADMWVGKSRICWACEARELEVARVRGHEATGKEGVQIFAHYDDPDL